MNGGPSQTDTFDLKPGHAHGGPFKAIATRTPGVSISEHLPRIANWTNRLAIVRSMSTREGDHDRAALNLRTGYAPQGSIQFPVLGSLVSKEFEKTTGDLPNYVSILPDRRAGLGPSPAGFLGAEYAPFLIGDDRQGTDEAGSPDGRESRFAGRCLEGAGGRSARAFASGRTKLPQAAWWGAGKRVPECLCQGRSIDESLRQQCL